MCDEDGYPAQAGYPFLSPATFAGSSLSMREERHPAVADAERRVRPRLRLGLCCQFVNQPIRFRTTTAAALVRLPRKAQLVRLAGLCLENGRALPPVRRLCARPWTPDRFSSRPVRGAELARPADRRAVPGRHRIAGRD